MRTRTFGVVLILLAFIGLMSAQQRSPQAAVSSPAGVAQTITQIDGDLVALDRSHQAYREAAEKLSTMYSELGKKVDLVGKAAAAAAAPGKAEASLAGLQAAVKDLQQLQAGYAPQYLQLQQAMQAQSRQFTSVSNVLKTRHDTVKNSINNVR